jgi:hypothetical protein
MNIIDQIKKTQMSFVKEEQIPGIIAADPFQQMLVRTGVGRFICPALNVKHFIKIIENEKSDYIRDVAIYTAP